MHIALYCATQRGLTCLRRICMIRPDARLTIFTFRETSVEPAFFDDISRFACENAFRIIESGIGAKTESEEFWKTETPDLLLAISWRYLIPSSIFSRARRGAFVIHDSLLPTYRGFSPTVWAIANGETRTGATLFEMTEEVDAGPIVDQQEVLIGPDETIFSISQKVTAIYEKLLDRNLNAILTGAFKRIAQDNQIATYGCRRIPEDNRIDWSWASTKIYNLIRAVTSPYAGAFTFLKKERLRIWEARRVDLPKLYIGRVPGRVVERCPGTGCIVLTGDGCLLVTRVQLEDQSVVCAADLLRSMADTLE